MSALTPIFFGTVSESGKILLDDPAGFAVHRDRLAGKRVELTLKKQARKRTSPQNRYYWGCVLQLISEHTGEDPESLHEALKAHFAPKHVIGNLVVPSGTRYLDTVDFSQFVEKVRRWAAEELNVNIPSPDEVEVNN